VAPRRVAARFSEAKARWYLAASTRRARKFRSGHACRVPRRRAFGRGFDSRRLHQTSLAYGELRLGKPASLIYQRSLSRRSTCRRRSSAKADHSFASLSFLSTLRSRRLQYFSTALVVGAGFSRPGTRLLQEPNRHIERGRTQVHVPLRRVQVPVSGQFLNGPCWRAAHRQMRTERMPQNVDGTRPGHACASPTARRAR
jgi:hypothetical protein